MALGKREEPLSAAEIASLRVHTFWIMSIQQMDGVHQSRMLSAPTKEQMDASQLPTDRHHPRLLIAKTFASKVEGRPIAHKREGWRELCHQKMVLIREFRIVMPMTLEEYERGLSYTIIKMEQQNMTSNEGVEMLQNIPFEDEDLGKGQYTSKVYRLESKIPPWLRTFAPAKALIVQEESWNAYQKSRTVLKCPYFDQCLLTIETINKADNGCSENVHGLSDALLAARKVEMIDIASVAKDYWSKVIGTAVVDFSKFKSQKTGRGPLMKGWKDTCYPVMTTYKLVTMNAPLWGFGKRLEEAMIAGERALFSECHRRCFAWIDEWFSMTMEQLYELERQNNLLLKKTLKKASPVISKGEFKDRNLQDNEKIIEVTIM